MSEYSKVTPEIVEKIKAVVAPNRVYTGADINEDFLTTRCLFMVRQCLN